VSSLTTAWHAVRDFWAGQVELHERMALLDRPWEQETLHWADGTLHGRVAPPADGRRRGVTSGGWCACHRGARTRLGR
jgi:hypothetical protein